MSKYTIGIDYGTLSARALLVDVSDGHELASSVFEYPHAVMTENLPDGTPLGPDWALQHPQDYLDALFTIVPAVVKNSGVQPADIIGLGIDFTSCTMLPVDRSARPLCFTEEFKNHPNAYVKLWKHHSTQQKADEIDRIAKERKEKWHANYGGKVSSEWTLPKIWELLDEDPVLYDTMYEYVEAGDWLVWLLTGADTRNSCSAGYKNFYNKQTGYPSHEFFVAIDPRLENVIEEKCFAPVIPIGSRAGIVKPDMAEKLGLMPGTAVSAANIDAHVCVAGAGVTRPGQMLAIVGTSTCHMTVSTVEKQVPGICGVVEDGLLPGFLGYEAGQSSVGDIFAWFCRNCAPKAYEEAAKERGMGIQQYLTELASALKPGESGLLALDWFNGNRSILVDFDLTGMLLGMTLQTKPEEIYRALIEATAYGTRMIVDNFRKYGVAVDEFFATGGISQKNAMAMQIYADVLNMPVRAVDAKQGAALGSAMFAATAAGKEAGGYDTVQDASAAMAPKNAHVYQPVAENARIYDELYQEYATLHDYFGRGINDVMKRLKKIRFE